MNPTAASQTPVSKRRERLAWLAPIALALLVVCSGCFMLFAFALTARAELEVSLLGSEWRVWQLQETGTSGLGVSQASPFSESGRDCRYLRVWLIVWRPSLSIENRAYEECDTSRAEPLPVARSIHSAIIKRAGG
jgi:hypothetical protein